MLFYIEVYQKSINLGQLLTSTYKLTGFYPYLETSLLFEGLSRVRKELLLVVINNLPLYEEILCILSWKEDKIYG